MSKKPDSDPQPSRGAPEKGQTLPRRHQQAAPRLPHERDESSDSHPGTKDKRIEQAARDLEDGQQDTGRAPVVTQLARTHFPDQGSVDKGTP